MVKKALLLILVNCLLLHSSILLTQNEVLAAVEATPGAVAVHLLPDNPLYFLKTIKEKVQLLVTRSTSGQADLLLTFSQKRLVEAQKVAEKGKVHISEKLLAAFGKDIETAQEKIKEAREKGEETRDLFLKLQKVVAYQKEMTDNLHLDALLVQIDESLTATESGKIKQPAPGGLEIFDWLRNMFGKKEILSPLVR